jgi:hypothetical protein
MRARQQHDSASKSSDGAQAARCGGKLNHGPD